MQISENQHGFMPGRSTVTNLLCLNSSITKAIDTNRQLDVIYTDFSKAFDSIDFGILIDKLIKLGFCKKLVKFLYSYLTQREMYVFYGTESSVCFVSTSGVPQGSVLGPLLFTLFINDLSAIFQSFSLLFADDLKIFRIVNDLGDCVAHSD